MKIGLVRRGFSPTGGAESYLIRLGSALQALGHVPVLVTSAEWPDSRWINDRIVRLNGRTPEEFAAAFQTEKTGCDIHLSLERVPGCEVFRAGDGVHAAWLERRKAFEPLWRRATRWLNSKHKQLLRLEASVFDPHNTRAIIANSHLVREEILAHSAFPAERISVVYNGLSQATVPADRTVSRKNLGIEPSEFCALFVGSGWERKGLRTAIEAVGAMQKTTLLVAGRGSESDYDSRQVKFLGPTSDLAGLFGAADIFVLPTYYDPFSNACLEALAAGLPVVTTPANGFSEILEPGVHGEIVPSGDAPALRAAMEKWRANDLCEKARPACLSLAASFSIERNARATLQVLENLSSPVPKADT